MSQIMETYRYACQKLTPNFAHQREDSMSYTHSMPCNVAADCTAIDTVNKL